MDIGIFAKTFNRPTLAETLNAVVSYDIQHVQFNLSIAGMPTLPDYIDGDKVGLIRHECVAHGISMSAISGTFNLIHPDLEKRRDGLRRLHVLASTCGQLGTPLITLCTGTRDPEDMWRWHPDNELPDAWEDLIASMRETIDIANAHDVVVGIEPETGNIINSPQQARRLLDELESPHVKIVMDGANLFHTDDLPRMRDVLDEAFALLGPDIVLAHVKELGRNGKPGNAAPGKGILDYDHYLSLLHQVGYTGPLIMHGLDEAGVREGADFLRGKLAAQN